MTERTLVSVGDVLNLNRGEYMEGKELGHGPHDFVEEEIKVRVKHVPEPRPQLGEPAWIALLVEEVMPDGGYGGDRCFAVVSRVLPGYRPPIGLL
jgi:hypothetical protein